MNVQDADVEPLLHKTTFLTIEQIQDTMNQHNQNPGKRLGQQLLARTLTELIHGSQALKKALSSTKSFFSLKPEDITKLSVQELEEHFQHTQKIKLGKSELYSLDFFSIVTREGIALRKTKADVRRVME